MISDYLEIKQKILDLEYNKSILTSRIIDQILKSDTAKSLIQSNKTTKEYIESSTILNLQMISSEFCNITLIYDDVKFSFILPVSYFSPL